MCSYPKEKSHSIAGYLKCRTEKALSREWEKQSTTAKFFLEMMKKEKRISKKQIESAPLYVEAEDDRGNVSIIQNPAIPATDTTLDAVIRRENHWRVDALLQENPWLKEVIDKYEAGKALTATERKRLERLRKEEL